MCVITWNKHPVPNNEEVEFKERFNFASYHRIVILSRILRIQETKGHLISNHRWAVVGLPCAVGNNRDVVYRVIQNDCRGLTACHTQYTWDRSICIFLFNRTTLQGFVTYLTGALYVRNCRWTIVTDRHSWNINTQDSSLPFASILVNCAPSGEMHNYCTPHIKENFENFLIHRCISGVLCMTSC
jgi:hypothetical protein